MSRERALPSPMRTETDPLQLIPAKGDGIPADRLAIDPYKSPLLHF